MFTTFSFKQKKSRQMFKVLRGQLHCVLNEGIGNRIIHLAAALRIAEYKDLPLHVWWVNQGVGASFDQGFKPIEGVEISSVENQEALPSGLKALKPGSWLWFLPEEIESRHSSAYPDKKIGGELIGSSRPGFKFYVELDWITPASQSLYRPFFQRIRFQDEILDHIKAEWGGVDPSSVIGVHFRFAQDMQNKLSKAGMTELASPEYVTPMLEDWLSRQTDSSVFLATDDPGVSLKMKRLLGAKLIEPAAREYGRGGAGNTLSALVDMGMLSQCSRLFLTYSSFGASAWWLSGCVPAYRVDHVTSGSDTTRPEAKPEAPGE